MVVDGGVRGRCDALTRTLPLAGALVLPDRIELFRPNTSALIDRAFFASLTLAVYQREEHL